MERLVKISFICVLVLYVVFAIIAKVPAQWGAKSVIKAIPIVKLGGVSGTLWKGRAESATLKLPGQVIDFGGLAWNVDAWSILSFKICANVSSALVELDICRSFSGSSHIRNLVLEELPAKMINNIIGFAKLEGNFSLSLKEADLNDKGIVTKMAGTLTWDGARGDAGGGWFDLGSFKADLSENGDGGVIADIVDTSGGFALALKGGYTVGGEPSLKGSITPRPEAHQQLVDSLGLFTEALDDGSYVVTWPM